MNNVLLRRIARFASRKLPITAGLRHSPTLHSQRRHHADTSLVLDYLPQQATHQGISAIPLSDAERKTIYALASAPGRAGVAVIRVSGPDALQVYDTMLVGPSKLPKPWMMRRCTVVHPIIREELDDGLCVFFKGPRSFTGEDVLELHIHGGRAAPAAVLRALSAIPTLRPAEPGEFSKRAFLAGRLDLAQAEALIDLVDAETEGQRKVARKGVSGEASRVYDKMRQDIIQCLAMVEALIDFGEGEDIEDGVFAQAQQLAIEVKQHISVHLADGRRGELLRSGIRLALFGPPNAGKSSLLNFLAQREAAIVTEQAGTTRDVLEVALDIGGLPVRVSDTAGLRDTEDLVERIGIKKARETIAEADISVCVLSAESLLNKNTDETQEYVRHIAPLLLPTTLLFVNKTDTIASPHNSLDVPSLFSAATLSPIQVWLGSLHSQEGMASFVSGITSVLQARFAPAGSSLQADDGSLPLITHARHRAHLESAVKFLDAFIAVGGEADLVVAAEELRYAAHAIGRVTGAIGAEDVLDAVFGSFCIGK